MYIPSDVQLSESSYLHFICNNPWFLAVCSEMNRYNYINSFFQKLGVLDSIDYFCGIL